ncbi:hypothetical protein [Nocardiopsis halotolerans]|uniref:hypothetical protein n=1 Tax=Nocardiopsis halotolerans TaxID=124252 RepID=UPI00034B7EC5|nr:hypothetical protein [Nocardiopsis halotolerans]
MSRVAGNTATFARLTWFNVVRLLRNPLLVPGSVAGSFLFVYPLWSVPAVTWRSWYNDLTYSAIAVGAVMFALVAFPATREVRYAHRLVSPLGLKGRVLSLMTASVLVSTLLLGALAGLVYWLSGPPLPGTLSPPAHPAPFLVAAAGPLLSIALVAWTRSYVPVVVAVLAVPAYTLYGASMMASRLDGMARVDLARFAMDPFHLHLPSVTGVAALYLVYLVLVVAVLVLLTLAARGHRAFRAVCLGTAAVLLAGVVGTVAHGRQTYARATPIPDSQVHGARGPSCQVRDGITYCPLPGYESWVEGWHGVLEPNLALLPEVPDERMPVVWQNSFSYNRDLEVPEDRDVMVHDYREGHQPHWRAQLVGDAARVALGVPDLYDSLCQGTNDARLMVVAWLLSTGDGMSRFEEREIIATSLFSYRPSPADLELSLALAELPVERVSEVLERNWERLSSSGGTSQEFAELLGVRLRETSARPASPEDWARLFPGHGYEHHLGEVRVPSAPACD